MSKFTYNVPLSTSSPDDVVEMGEIEKEAALSVVGSFPFQEGLAKRAKNPSLMAPTLTFSNNTTGQDLAIWSEIQGQYTIWKPDAMACAECVETMQHLLACVALFFDEQDEELNALLEQLSSDNK